MHFTNTPRHRGSFTLTSDCLGGWYEAWWLSTWGLKPDVLEFDQVPGMGFKQVTLAPEPPSGVRSVK